MLKKKTRFYVYAYVGGLSSVRAVELFSADNEKSAYAFLETYLKNHPECVKCYIDVK